jgi:hypothetical protein
MDVTKESFQQALAEPAEASLQDRRSASSAVMRWKKEGHVDGDHEDLTRLYLGLKQSKGPDGKVTPSLMRQWKRELKTEVVLKHPFYIVEKEDMPDVPEAAKRWLRNPDGLANWPANIDADSIWLLDRRCNGDLLPDNIVEADFQIVDSRRLEVAPGSAARPVTGSNGTEGAVDSLNRQASLSPQKNADAQNNKSKLLVRRDSDTEETAAQALFKATKDALDRGKYSVKDKAYPFTLEAWMLKWLSHVDGLRDADPSTDIEAFCESLSPYNKNYIPFVVPELLTKPCWPSLPPICAIMQKVSDKYPPLMSTLAHAIVKLSDLGDDDSAVSADVAGRKLSSMPSLYLSELHKSWMGEREDRRLQRIIHGDMLPTAKLEMLEEMLEVCSSDDRKASMLFGKAYFKLTGGDLLAWLMEDMKRFLHLAQWDPKHEMNILKPFADPATKWQTIPPSAFMSGVVLLCKYQAIDKVKNVLAKSLAHDVSTIQDAIAEADSQMEGFVINFVHELLTARLGIPGETDAEHITFMEEHCPDKLKRVLYSTAKKVLTKAKGSFPVLLHVETTLAQRPEMPPTAATPLPPAEVGAAVATEAPSAQSPAAPSGGGVAEGPKFQVNQIVYTKAVKHPEDWHNHKAFVLRVPSSAGGKYKVRLEEGPQQGKTREYAPQMLAVTAESDSANRVGLAAPAGTSGTDQAKAERKKRAAEAAAELFSKLPKL